MREQIEEFGGEVHWRTRDGSYNATFPNDQAVLDFVDANARCEVEECRTFDLHGRQHYNIKPGTVAFFEDDRWINFLRAGILRFLRNYRSEE